MRVLLWHGWLLEGSGSNVYTAKVAEALRRAGHDVALLCQERHSERFDFIDAVGEVGDDMSPLRETGAAPQRGRLTLLRPRIGRLLPVFVRDEYEDFDVLRFVELSDAQLNEYLDANASALRTAVDWHGADLVVAGHVIPGAPIARRALDRAPYVVKVHGSDLEYAIREQERYRALAHAGLERATSVVGASREVLERTVEFVPDVRDRVRVVPPGVDVESFRPMPRREALEMLAGRLDAAEFARRRTKAIDDEVRRALEERDAGALSKLSGRYDQAVPDAETASVARSLAAFEGPLIGYFGKLIPPKGPDIVLSALALLPRRVRALLVGFGSGREWLAALTIALDAGRPSDVRWVRDAGGLNVTLSDDEAAIARGISSRVTFTGRLDHHYAPYALAAMDVLVVPSVLPEAFGMVAAEGAAVGAVPLVARHSGLAEVAAALEAATESPGWFSFEPGPGAEHRIADAVEHLLQIPLKERERLRTAVSEFASNEWTWDRTAERLLETAKARS